jgi:AraC-like DNA-binding protein
MNNIIEIIQNKCDLIATTYDLPVFFFNPGGEVVYENLYKHLLNPIYENQTEKFFNPLNFKPSREYRFPVIRKSVYSEKYILISIFNNHTFKGTVIIGPSLAYPISEDRISGIVNDSRAFFYRQKVFKYYNSLPIINPEKLLNISIVAFHLFTNELLSPDSVRSENAESELTATTEKVKKVNLAVSENLQSQVFHNNRLFEKKILYFIKEGKVEDLKELNFIKEEETASALSKTSYLRSIKNHIITLITLVSRVSIEGGLHEEIAFSLHDSFIQQLEELDRLDEVRILAGDVLYTFAKEVKQVKNEMFSKKITACKNFIFRHIYENISHDDIAKKVELNPKYLSVLFKKEVGISVSEYIQQTKIDEAKKLLGYSKTPISEICSLLHFNDQSYFTKVFKKVVGITPKQYRERHHLLENE